MIRNTFLILGHSSDCCEECPVQIERGVMWDEANDPAFTAYYRLVSYPASCKCGFILHRFEPTQDELKAAYALPESEAV